MGGFGRKLRDGFIFVFGILTFPIWVIALIIIVLNMPDELEGDADHYYI